MIPAAPFQALQNVAKSRSSAHHAGEFMSEIQGLLAESLPLVETARRGCDARVPSRCPRPPRNLVLAGGKRVRPLTALLVHRTCGGIDQAAVPLAAAVELIHSATLLHDDVMDEGEERRGRPASRVLWGNLVSVLSGDLLLTAALELVAAAAWRARWKTPSRRCARWSAARSRSSRPGVARTSGSWIPRDRAREDGFAVLLRLPARRARRAGSPETIDAAGRFGDRVGVAFQIVDDVLDLEGVPHEVGKRLGNDLAEGKTTLPLALALEHSADELRPLLVDARAGDTLAAAKVSRAPCVREACGEARAFALARDRTRLAELALLPEGRTRELLARSGHQFDPAQGLEGIKVPMEPDDSGDESIPSEPLWPSERIVSDSIGRLMELWGFKRNMGRVWTVLYLAGEPITAKQLRARLQLSSGAVSMTLNELARWGVVRKMWVQGDRRDFFEAEANIWKMVSRVMREREQSEIGQAIEAFEEALVALDRQAEEDAAAPTGARPPAARAHRTAARTRQARPLDARRADEQREAGCQLAAGVPARPQVTSLAVLRTASSGARPRRASRAARLRLCPARLHG